MEENELLVGLANGEEEAYQELFKRFYEPLCYFANRYLQDLDQSQDLVQELMSYLYENRDRIVVSTSLKAFLYRSVTNRSLNQIKKDKRQDENHREIAYHAESTNFHDLMEISELQARINQLISELPPQCERIFRMSRMEHLSNQEIADELNISKRTVETQISKALKVLRNSLKIIIIEFFFQNL